MISTDCRVTRRAVEIDDEDDDIEQIRSKILKTLSKIEQAEVD